MSAGRHYTDKADQYPLQVGDTIDLSFDIESREYNGRWFTSIRGWKAEKIADNATASAAAVAAPAMPQGTPQPPIAPQAADEDLPF